MFGWPTLAVSCVCALCAVLLHDDIRRDNERRATGWRDVPGVSLDVNELPETLRERRATRASGGANAYHP